MEENKVTEIQTEKNSNMKEEKEEEQLSHVAKGQGLYWAHNSNDYGGLDFRTSHYEKQIG